MLALLCALLAQEEIKDGKTYVNPALKLTFSIPSPEWGKLRIGGQLEWRWAGGLCEFVDAKANVAGCLAAEETTAALEEYVKQFEEGLKKNDGSKKLERKAEAKLPGDRLRIDYSWDYKEWTLTYVAVFHPLEKRIAKLCVWTEAKNWNDVQGPVTSILESFRSTDASDSGAPKKVEHAWAKSGEGSWTEHRLVTKAGGIETEMTVKRMLLKKSAEELVFRLENKMVKPNPSEIPASESAEKVWSEGGAAPKELGKGEEELDVAGRKIKCRWVEVESESGGKKTVTRSWTSDEVPGGLVKSRSKGADLESEMTLIGFEKK